MASVPQPPEETSTENPSLPAEEHDSFTSSLEEAFDSLFDQATPTIYFMTMTLLNKRDQNLQVF
jgi:hypothetical protein